MSRAAGGRSPTSASAATPCPAVPPGTSARPCRCSWRPRSGTARVGDPASDVYTAGALLYFAVTGQSPPLDPRAGPPADRASADLPAGHRADRAPGAAAGARGPLPHRGGDAGGLRLGRRRRSRPGPSPSAEGPVADTEDRARWEKLAPPRPGRRLRAARAARHRRLRPGLPGARPAPGARGGAQGAAPGADAGPGGGRAIPARGAARRPAQPPEHREHLRHRRAVRADLVHDGADRRAQPGAAGRARRAAAAAAGAPAAAGGAVGAGPRARLRPGAPRHQAGEHADRSERAACRSPTSAWRWRCAGSTAGPRARAGRRSSPAPSSCWASGWTSAPTSTAWPRWSYYALLGTPPFPGATTEQVLAQQTTNQLPDAARAARRRERGAASGCSTGRSAPTWRAATRRPPSSSRR